MAATVPGEQQQSTPTVAGCAQLCFRSFQECLDKAASIHSRELSLVEDQLARFSLWTANISVFAPSRGSLDHRLREAPDVQDVVTGLLEALDYQIKDCSHIIDSLSPGTSGGSLSAVDENFDQALRAIESEISLLHKFTNTIRKASKETQNHKAAKAFQIRDEHGNNVESFLKELFSNSIRDRFPAASDNIRLRLANTMLLRRKRILYRRFRYGKTSIRSQEVPSQPSITRPEARPAMNLPQEPTKPRVTAVPSQSAIQSVAQTATTLLPESFQKASSPSVVSVSKTVALSRHEDLRFPPAPCGNLMRKYNKLKKQLEEKRGAFLDPNDINRRFVVKNKEPLDNHWSDYLRAIGEITCPFCFYALPAQEVVDEKKWRLHVKNDLDPYVCLFEECDSAEELYSHSHAWLKHMRGHVMRWRCVSKSHGEFVATTRDEYLSHMKTAHPAKLTDAQLGVMADRNSRIAGPLFKSCPLCGIENVDDKIEDHIVGHMRFLALKSLPSYEEDTEELDESDSQNDSLATSRPQSRSTIKNDTERYTKPIFSSPMFLPLEADESTELVYEGLFDDVPSENRRLFEWGFIPEAHGSSMNLKDDPVLMAFLQRMELHRAKIATIKMDPDCAICHAPAQLACDCEAKAFEEGVKNAEAMIMSQKYNDIRSWVRQKSENFIIEPFKVNSNMMQRTASDFNQFRELSPRQLSMTEQHLQIEINKTWQAAYQRYPETMEAYFSLVDLSVPDDDHPAVRDPPLKEPGRMDQGKPHGTQVLDSDQPLAKETPPGEVVYDRRGSRDIDSNL
ncbi:hypothetical protein F4775DRAFT_548461 [Biscogniauxia sp. FL1348]|nr:hypothetical protein F4775DRAFT_548461 [Biscogniauxia sp. FL1348]